MVPQTELLEIPEGKLFWRYDGPLQDERDQPWTSCENRPTLLFIHAGVADHTLWDEEISTCTSHGWGCLRYDLFGFGRSSLDRTLGESGIIPAVRHHFHAAKVAEAFSNSSPMLKGRGARKFIVIGLSRGGGIAINFALSFPQMVIGLVICAGALGGLEIPNTPPEDSLFNDLEEFTKKGEVENATRTLVHIWGDGPREKEGRCSSRVRHKLHTWCSRIVETEIAGVGGDAIPHEELHPPAAQRLNELKFKTLVAAGRYDESSTTKTMAYFAQHTSGARLREFEAGHMINLECPSAFNEWLGAFLQEYLE